MLRTCASRRSRKQRPFIVFDFCRLSGGLPLCSAEYLERLFLADERDTGSCPCHGDIKFCSDRRLQCLIWITQPLLHVSGGMNQAMVESKSLGLPKIVNGMMIVHGCPGILAQLNGAGMLEVIRNLSMGEIVNALVSEALSQSFAVMTVTWRSIREVRVYG